MSNPFPRAWPHTSSYSHAHTIMIMWIHQKNGFETLLQELSSSSSSWTKNILLILRKWRHFVCDDLITAELALIVGCCGKVAHRDIRLLSAIFIEFLGFSLFIAVCAFLSEKSGRWRIAFHWFEIILPGQLMIATDEHLNVKNGN